MEFVGILLTIVRLTDTIRHKEMQTVYLNDLLTEKNMSRYRLAKESEVSQTTVVDICSGKARMEKCSAKTLYKIAKAASIILHRKQILRGGNDNVYKTSKRTARENV